MGIQCVRSPCSLTQFNMHSLHCVDKPSDSQGTEEDILPMPSASPVIVKKYGDKVEGIEMHRNTHKTIQSHTANALNK